MKKDLHVTISPDVSDMIEELEKLTGWNRSRCVDEALRIGLRELIKKYRAMVQKADKPTLEDEERAREEYWRKVILGDIHADKWVRDGRWG
jgi:hypothetical protein